MTPEEQRIAIAEACGLERCHPYNQFDDFTPRWYWKGGYYNLEELPDYLNDLNAMHEARLFLTRCEDRSKYENRLRDICGSYCDAIHATAAQRAEAFLKTIGKCKDKP